MSRVSGLLGQALPRVGKSLTYFVAQPRVGVSMLNIFLKSQHGEHERPRFVAYPHLCISTKPFPW
ncbi:Cytochrome c oxidase subunit 6A1, mitochondrial [Lemmus lemmus]